MDEVARAARCDEATLGRFFPSKSDLFLAALHAADAERTFGKLDVDTIRTHPSLTFATKALVDFLCKVLDRTYSRLRVFAYLERPDIMQEFFRHSAQPYISAFAARLRAERVKGNLRKEVDVDTAIAVLVFACGFRSIFDHLDGEFDGIAMNRRDRSTFVDVWINGIVVK